ncbi:Protein of unknown function [Gryllus bimaculatus]|nr:Protein of unknown function [Gryllus bimaculatus]
MLVQLCGDAVPIRLKNADTKTDRQNKATRTFWGTILAVGPTQDEGERNKEEVVQCPFQISDKQTGERRSGMNAGGLRDSSVEDLKRKKDFITTQMLVQLLGDGVPIRLKTPATKTEQPDKATRNILGGQS